ncbi:MAG: DUF721 domain-containing protein [Alphaproteobacteria bacterium]
MLLVMFQYCLPGMPIKPLHNIIPKISRTAYKRKGFAHAGLISNWAQIIGPEFAKSTHPVRLSFKPNTRQNGVLHLNVSSGSALLLKHIEPEILDRINSYFGYPAVAHIKYNQQHIVQAVKKAPAKQDGPKKSVELPDIADEGLRQALQEYGQSILSQDVSKK